ncbi:la protein homolog [Toxorhynchites rutilus septentrionalis]|uniref:la protein homolog n=1 Tax=Toxorhynchites rutilus septentrionalis TaxID=329112 RepID=UPI00247A0AFE|nr:la protein homolog [Toxorhynchites rutilus septentrionalis]XP_055637784.1 la protein homolog [Toxorhynchites rutilus septentrionalis]
MTEAETKVASTEEPVKTEESTVAAEETSQPENVSKLEASIIRQLEYYFGDANLARDKFLLEQTTKDDGWVTLEVLLTFKRLKALSEDKKVIVDAIEKSDEGLIEISEDREKLRRHPERPIPEQNEETRKEIYARTVYVKGFAAQDGTQMSELIEFFEPFENVTNIVMRKYHDKATKKYLFKGSVFVTFATKEQCAEFLLKDKLEYKGKVLIRKMQDDYFEEKKTERKKKDKKKEEDKLDITHLPKGACVHLDGFGKETTFGTIKDTIHKLDESLEVAYIDYQKSDSSGVVRFVAENVGKKFIEKLTDSKIKIDDEDITARLLEGDEETEFLRKVVKEQQARRTFNNARNRGRHQKGGKHNKNSNNSGGKKRKTEEASGDEPANKKTAPKADA